MYVFNVGQTKLFFFRLTTLVLFSSFQLSLYIKSELILTSLTAKERLWRASIVEIRYICICTYCSHCRLLSDKSGFTNQ